MLVRQFTVKLNAGANVNPVIHVNQYDQDEKWCFTLVKNSEVYQPETTAIVGLSANGHVYEVGGYVDALGRAIIFETREITSAVGQGEYELTIDDGTHGTANFYINVEERPTDGAVISDDEINYFQELVNQSGTNAASAAQSAEDIDEVVAQVSGYTDFTQRTEITAPGLTDLFATQTTSGTPNSIAYTNLLHDIVFNQTYTIHGVNRTIAEGLEIGITKGYMGYLTGTNANPYILHDWHTVGDEITLRVSATTYSYIVFRLGSDTDSSSGGGHTFVWLPVSAMGTDITNSQWALTYFLNGAICNITIQFESNLKVKILKVYCSTGSMPAGIRAVYGVI